MEDPVNISSFTNEELFKYLKKCGINAGPITTTTRSVYEKKLRNHLNINKEQPNENQVTNLKANLEIFETEKKKEPVAAPISKPVENKQTNLNKINTINIPSQKTTEPAKTLFVKPALPQEHSSEIIHVEKSTRNILRNSNEENESVNTKSSEYTVHHTTNIFLSRNESLKKESSESPLRESPLRTTNLSSNSDAKLKETSRNLKKDVPKPEFKLLKPQMELEHNYVSGLRRETGFTTPNIRKRTATIEKPTVISNKSHEGSSVTAEKKAGGSGMFNLKYMALVMFVTAIVYMVMIHLQSNPENPLY